MLHDVGSDGLKLGAGWAASTQESKVKALVRATRAGGGVQGPAGSCTFDVMVPQSLTSLPHPLPSHLLENDEMALADALRVIPTGELFPPCSLSMFPAHLPTFFKVGSLREIHWLYFRLPVTQCDKGKTKIKEKKETPHTPNNICGLGVGYHGSLDLILTIFRAPGVRMGRN